MANKSSKAANHEYRLLLPKEWATLLHQQRAIYGHTVVGYIRMLVGQELAKHRPKPKGKQPEYIEDTYHVDMPDLFWITAFPGFPAELGTIWRRPGMLGRMMLARDGRGDPTGEDHSQWHGYDLEDHEMVAAYEGAIREGRWTEATEADIPSVTLLDQYRKLG